MVGRGGWKLDSYFRHSLILSEKAKNKCPNGGLTLIRVFLSHLCNVPLACFLSRVLVCMSAEGFTRGECACLWTCGEPVFLR